MRLAGAVAGALALAAVAVALGWLFESPLGTQTEPQPTRRDAAPLRYEWSPEARQSYRFELASDVQLTLLGAETPGRLEQRIAGMLHLRVLEVLPTYTRVGLQLDPVSYTLNGERDDVLEAGLGLPFVAEFETSGRPRAFRFADLAGGTERKLLEEAVRTFQAVLPDDGSASWTTSERHGSGRYLAYYRNLGAGTLTKQKTLYTETDPQIGLPGADGPSEIGLRKSTATLQLEPGISWLESATVHEEIVVQTGRRRVAEVATRAVLALVPVSVGDHIVLFQEGADPLAAASKAATQAAREDSRNREDSRLREAEARFAELLRQMDGEEGERLEWVNRLSRALRDAPELAFRLLDVLAQAETRQGSRARIIHALELAGTPQAQSALVSVAGSSSSLSMDRVRALVALGAVANASEETVEFLLRTAENRGDPLDQELANAAALAAGSVVHSLSERDPERARDLGDRLASSLDSSADPLEAEVLLKALGNAQDAEAADAVIQRLDDNSPFVRAAAARALARIDAEDALEILTHLAETEQSVDVRAEVVSALNDLGEASTWSVQVVEDLVLNEADPIARYRMVRYLGDNLALHPQTDTTLKRLALTDPSPRVRQSAMSALLRPNEQDEQ